MGIVWAANIAIGYVWLAGCPRAGGPCYFSLRLLAFVKDPLGQSLRVVIGRQSGRHLFATFIRVRHNVDHPDLAQAAEPRLLMASKLSRTDSDLFPRLGKVFFTSQMFDHFTITYRLRCGMAQIGPAYYEEMAKDYQEKRDYFCDILKDIGLTPHVPAGAYYVLADVRGLEQTSAKAAAMHILETVGVASVPGSAFYDSEIGEGLTRFCYAKDWDVLKSAGEQLKKLK